MSEAEESIGAKARRKLKIDPEFEKALDEHEKYMVEKRARQESLFRMEDGAMQRMKDLITVSDEMNLKRIGRDVDLYSNAKRKLLGTITGEFRIKNLESPLRKCKVYIFNDLLIIAKYQKYTGKRALMKARESGDSSSGAIEFAEVVGRRRHSESDDELEGESSEEGGEQKSKPSIEHLEYVRLEMRMWLDLSKVHVRLVEDKKSGAHGVSLTYVFKRKKRKDGRVNWDNNVKNTEFWCKDEKAAEELIDPIIEAKDELTKEEIRQREESKIAYEKALEEAKKTGKRIPRRRRYVDSITKMKKIQAARQRYAGSLGKSKSLMDDEEIKLSLEELHNKYNINVRNAEEEKKEEAKKKEMSAEEAKKKEKEEEEVVFSCNFNEGKLGMQISSHELVGVFVAKLAPNGMADASGIALGDRVLEINNTFIPKNKRWQDCLELLAKRPVKVKFTRTNLQDEAYLAEKEAREIAEKELIEKQIKEREEKRKNRPRTLRKWKQAHMETKKHGGKMETIEDLERFYKEGKLRMEMIPRIASMFKNLISASKVESEKQTLYTLQEIYTTERTYVDQVSNLVWEFKHPLMKATYKAPCRDLDVKFCEHDVKALECDQFATTPVHIMTRSDVDRIFMNIENMIMINKKLLDKLEKGMCDLMDKIPEKAITVSALIKVYHDIFVPIAPFFKMYGTYAIHLVAAHNHFNILYQTNPDFQKLVVKLNEKASKRTEKHLRADVKTLIGTPSQRITKYQLLFLNLAKAATPYMRIEAGYAMDEIWDTSVEFKAQMIIHGDKEDPSEARRKTLALIAVDEMASNLVTMYQTYHETASGVEDYVRNQNRLDDLMRINAELGGDEVVPGLLKGSRKFIETITCYVKFDTDKKQNSLTVHIFKDLVLGVSPIPTTWKKLLPRKTFVHGRDSVKPSKASLAKQDSAGSDTRKPSDTGTVSGATDGKRTKKTAKTDRTLKPKMRPRLWLDLHRVNQVCDASRKEEGRYGFTMYLPVRVAPGDTYRKKKNKSGSLDTKLEIYGFWFEAEEERNRVKEMVEGYMLKIKKDTKARKAAQRKARMERYGRTGEGRRLRRYRMPVEERKKSPSSQHHLDRISKLEKLVEERKAAEQARLEEDED